MLQARERGANGVIGIDLDYETIDFGDNGGMLDGHDQRHSGPDLGMLRSLGR